MNHSLISLYVDSNELGNGGLIPIDSLINGMNVNSTLQILNLDNNKFSAEFGYKLTQMLTRNNSLNRFSFRNNRLNDIIGTLFINIYKNSLNLIEFGLSKDEIGELNWKELKLIYSTKCALINRNEMLLETIIHERNDDFTDVYHKKYHQLY